MDGLSLYDMFIWKYVCCATCRDKTSVGLHISMALVIKIAVVAYPSTSASTGGLGD
jgi:hypothetical protein